MAEAPPTEPPDAGAAQCRPATDAEDELSDGSAEPAAAASDPPEAFCSQDAGEQQYRDPFAGSEPPGGKGGGGEGNSSQSGTSPSEQVPAPTTAGTTAEGDPLAAAPAAGGKQLPSTGLGLPSLLALGLPLLLAGLTLRRRLA